MFDTGDLVYVQTPTHNAAGVIVSFLFQSYAVKLKSGQLVVVLPDELCYLN